MPSYQLLLMVDDPQLNATYGGGQWGTSTYFQWYGGSIGWPIFADSTSATLTGFVFLSFEGIAIAFGGNTPKVFGDSQTLTVSIDGAPPYNTSYNDPTPQSYVQWYQSPILPEGTHNITLTHMAGTALDYAVISAGQNTPLTGKTVIVDNEDPSIRFTGSWTRNTDRFHSGTEGYPFHNSTHQSTTSGTSFIFRFSGTSLNVYGILHWADLGTLSASYTLDGATTALTYSVTTSSSNYQDNTYDQHNFLLYSNSSLTASDHTLVVKVTECVNQTYYAESHFTRLYQWNIAYHHHINPRGSYINIHEIALTILTILFARAALETNAGSAVLLQSGPPRVVHKSSRSRGGETADISTSRGNGMEMREARPSVAPPAYQEL
ncbi:uncharacterized protein LACBIDRAFT_331846 [Laccaria bicolor S238N-H82]|uniref:Predicted protein n=1 Tax=Laccaria bicolor (strain S238N-H82 / ATCC MYA-4686) TaxID=486041 RepID=B0DQR5_LACBS|nr:uncharacterized protein LACBIDRAFT_331846 [Laccaria bicolor S238N-H82]EDR03078.1 predicted protein [Laccaria bicolor S238N-H82]|eukprot:XP_001886219.1 predicted protein [Laccaria bicolor S238N-H82]